MEEDVDEEEEQGAGPAWLICGLTDLLASPTPD